MFDYIKHICTYKYEPLFNYPNVVGVADSYKITRDVITTTPSITLFVSKKVPYNSLSSDTMIPKSYMGVITDVIETGFFKPLALTSKQRPMTFGYSIGVNHSSMTKYFGTAGYMVTSKNPKNEGKKYILSCNHVLVNNDSNLVGADVIQPSKANVWFDYSKVATVTSFVPIMLQTPSFIPENLVDCAIAELISNDIAEPSIEFIGPPTGTNVAVKDSSVKRVGAASGLTYGKVSSITATLDTFTNNSKSSARFIKQIVVDMISKPGDSGAVLLNMKSQVIGLLNFGSDNKTSFNPIDEVLRSLNINIYVPPLNNK